MDEIGQHTGEPAGEGPGERSPEGQWLTYDEIGRIRGIGRESAVKLAQRKRWRRLPGNDGVARVFVPPDWLTRAQDRPGKPPPEHSPEHSPERALLAGALAALENAVTDLRQRAEAADLRAERAEQGLAAERSRADVLRSDLDHARAAAGEATEAARIATDALNTLRRASEAEQARGRLRRVWRAWRGV